MIMHAQFILGNVEHYIFEAGIHQRSIHTQLSSTLFNSNMFIINSTTRWTLAIQKHLITFFHQMNNTKRPKSAGAKYHVQLLDLTHVLAIRSFP